MDFQTAIKKSVKTFLSGKTPEALREAKGEDFYYTAEYFDLLEEKLDEEDTPDEA